ncbi:hypothetical protein ASG43_08815 [Aureimonas sp. Leaf454]|uniref:DUF2497 domain-containing protein n=1 Tax=Aureimonas sp. Leaf454 TaxID=1736381 RepID=UPI0006F83D5B|nr:DUF2497 domain-containing protein [Aureimonas sp. Leaf454]KQT48928.1 hypothetical protein ASG43_08815 [Aureimonas sp. Leaf454]
MDEILASIRRIIESGDDRSAPVPPIAAGNRPGNDVAKGVAQTPSASAARPASFALPPSAARIVPLTERIAAARAVDVEEGRWLPAVEPANRAADETAQPPALRRPPAENDPTETAEAEAASSSLPEPIVARDRWTREWDDVETWPVLRDEPRGERAAPETTEPLAAAQHRAAAASSEAAEEPSLATTAAAPDPAVAAVTAVEEDGDEDDFAMDFDEADFVEALDRNASVLGLRESEASEPAGPVPAGPVQQDLVAPASSPASLAPPSPVPASWPSVSPVLVASAPLSAASAVEDTGRVETAVPTPSEPASVMQEASALMSAQAGAQVAAAFDDLARAIRDGQMKSMEDMAREMLRPMLQDWLDDNLPRLVERLVREEIERVSRGGRR